MEGANVRGIGLASCLLKWRVGGPAWGTQVDSLDSVFSIHYNCDALTVLPELHRKEVQTAAGPHPLTLAALQEAQR